VAIVAAIGPDGPLRLADGARVRVTLARSVIGRSPRHRATVAALGLHGIGSSAEHIATAPVVGMIRKVRYLLAIEEIS
jgi:large subunit ribosomal protein L30